MKKCSKCEVLKELFFFNKSKRGKDGYYNHCKLCESVYRKPLWATTAIAMDHGESPEYIGNLEKSANI